jgi:hypothetical protein
MVGQDDDVGGVGVHLVAGVGLGRTAMAATVMRDDAIALGEEEHHLGVPVVGAERPAVMEHDRLSVLGTPVLVEDLRAVLDGDEAALSAVGGARRGSGLRGRGLGCLAQRGGRHGGETEAGGHHAATGSLVRLAHVSTLIS